MKTLIDLEKPSLDSLTHYGILGMKWGVRRYQNKDGSLTSYGKARKKIIEEAYSLGSKLQPREGIYTIKKAISKPPTQMEKQKASSEIELTKKTGVLTTTEESLEVIEKVGIERHKEANYNNIDDADIDRFKKYTNAAIYSRSVNSYLATGSPKEIAKEAKELKESLSKNTINNQTVYRSCNLKFSTEGLAKKLETYDKKQLTEMFDSMSRNFKNKTFSENRIYSTSTSPLFAVDTWRKVNPTAAKTYNTYLIIDCKNTPGIYADGQTSNGKKLVNTKSNQECILAPNEMVYKKLTYDRERNMYAIHMEAR